VDLADGRCGDWDGVEFRKLGFPVWSEFRGHHSL
jgi:hypothetical protein